jgi:hypothetical protein
MALVAVEILSIYMNKQMNFLKSREKAVKMKRETVLLILTISVTAPIALTLGLPGFSSALNEAQADHLGRQVCVDKPTGSYCYYEVLEHEEDQIEPIPVPPEYICEKNPHAGGCEYYEGLPEEDVTRSDFRKGE